MEQMKVERKNPFPDQPPFELAQLSGFEMRGRLRHYAEPIAEAGRVQRSVQLGCVPIMIETARGMPSDVDCPAGDLRHVNHLQRRGRGVRQEVTERFRREPLCPGLSAGHRAPRRPLRRKRPAGALSEAPWSLGRSGCASWARSDAAHGG